MHDVHGPYGRESDRSGSGSPLPRSVVEHEDRVLRRNRQECLIGGGRTRTVEEHADFGLPPLEAEAASSDMDRSFHAGGEGTQEEGELVALRRCEGGEDRRLVGEVDSDQFVDQAEPICGQGDDSAASVEV